MAISEIETPEKYRPTDRRYSDKEWLYRQYWHNLEPIESIADMTDMSATTIGRQLEKHGIVRRDRNTTAENHEHLGKALRDAYGCNRIEDDDHSVTWLSSSSEEDRKDL